MSGLLTRSLRTSRKFLEAIHFKKIAPKVNSEKGLDVNLVWDNLTKTIGSRTEHQLILWRHSKLRHYTGCCTSSVFFFLQSPESIRLAEDAVGCPENASCRQNFKSSVRSLNHKPTNPIKMQVQIVSHNFFR